MRAERGEKREERINNREESPNEAANGRQMTPPERGQCGVEKGWPLGGKREKSRETQLMGSRPRRTTTRRRREKRLWRRRCSKGSDLALD